ncbi:2'-5' RNA ligase family protein [Bacillus sp. KH172YL63]|uniref:2'-5' RNA ligase family protein n=1 Tax=Bacillus sp. KH172YL63 TaxID=2709784 RepID=UPI0013E4A11C|nr:2'-5' RNA ligase family protein [Bacillus sp. KH172YL63]BCB03535.1 hypothetical protein KH172YL63_16680 [Bacillus sp. KH172YL63]
MEKDYFIGIVPPPEYLERIEQFQGKWIAKPGVEPHITLKAQGGLTPDEKWMEAVQRVCEGFTPFPASLEEPKYFGDTILYLSVNSNNLHRLHQKIVQAISPTEEEIQQYFEGNDFVPHLTLGKEHYGRNITDGLSHQQLKEMENAAPLDLAPYPEFEVNFIRVYVLNLDKQKYEKYIDIPLGH